MTLKTDLYDLVQPILGGAVIWADQNASRPALPYCAIKVQSMRVINHEHYQDPNNVGVQTITGDREFTFNVQRFGVDSAITLQSFVDSLKKTTNIDKFIAKKLPLVRTEAVTDIASLLDKAVIEPRASVDVIIRLKSVLTDSVGYIDSVIVNKDDDAMDDGQTVQTQQTIDLVNVIGP